MVRAYVQRIGATLNIIYHRKFPQFPVEYEAMQIWEAGAAFDWNLHIAAGMLLGDKLPDPTNYASTDRVATNMTFGAQFVFETAGNIYFERDERYIGISEGILLSHAQTHDIWQPLPGSFASYRDLIKDGRHERIASYALSVNLAKYGLKLSGIFPPQAQVDSIQNERLAGGSVEEYVSKVVKKWRSDGRG